MGNTSLATKITCRCCGHSVIANVSLMDSIDRTMASGASARPKMRCSKCQQKNAEIDFCATGEFFCDGEFEEFALNAQSDEEYSLAAIEFMNAKDKYELIQPLGFDRDD